MTPTERDVIAAADEFAAAFGHFRRAHLCQDNYTQWAAACRAYFLYTTIREALDENEPDDWICECGRENGGETAICHACAKVRL